jgi:hypothetical protein
VLYLIPPESALSQQKAHAIATMAAKTSSAAAATAI